MLRDWSSLHLLDCGWYLYCPNENTPSLEFKIQKKHDLGFFEGLGALEKETPTKEKLEGGRRKGKRQIFGICIRDAR